MLYVFRKMTRLNAPLSVKTYAAILFNKILSRQSFIMKSIYGQGGFAINIFHYSWLFYLAYWQYLWCDCNTLTHTRTDLRLTSWTHTLAALIHLVWGRLWSLAPCHQSEAIHARLQILHVEHWMHRNARNAQYFCSKINMFLTLKWSKRLYNYFLWVLHVICFIYLVKDHLQHIDLVKLVIWYCIIFYLLSHFSYGINGENTDSFTVTLS